MKYRAIFISDLHLGTKDSQVEALLNFLRENESEYLFLVGDIIDGWALKRKWHWPQNHSDLIQKILRKARKGTKVIYILGNHDEFIRNFLPMILGNNLAVVNKKTFIGLNKKRYLVTHGDFFDSITMTKRWLAMLGDIGYTLLLKLNRPITTIRKFLGYKKYWSLSKYIKENVKTSLMFITDFEKILSREAKRLKYDGVICGHIHKAEIREIEEIEYLNCGDWVESCSAIVETMEGEWEVVNYFS